MADLRQHIVDFQKKAVNLDRKAKNVSPRLFLFDGYRPKRIPTMVDSAPEVAFWYLIVDLYGLFFDAGSYIKQLNVWKDDKTTVEAFYDALNEIRSVFCHNKPLTSYLPSLITNADLNKLVPDWEMKSAVAQELAQVASKNPEKSDPTGTMAVPRGMAEFPFEDFFGIFLAAADEMLNLIDRKMLTGFVQYTDDKIYEEWFKPIFHWWMDNSIVYIRAWTGICRGCKGCNSYNETKTEKYLQSRLERCLSNKCLSTGSGPGSNLWTLRDNYGYNMYHTHFFKDASPSKRKNLTPRSLLEPLLMHLLGGAPFPEGLFVVPDGTVV